MIKQVKNRPFPARCDCQFSALIMHDLPAIMRKIIPGPLRLSSTQRIAQEIAVA